MALKKMTAYNPPVREFEDFSEAEALAQSHNNNGRRAQPQKTIFTHTPQLS